MKVAGSKEFVPSQKRYFDMAIEEDVCVENGQNRFHFMCNSVEEPHAKEQVYYQPDEDFYRSISMEEVREKLHRVVDKLYANQ